MQVAILVASFLFDLIDRLTKNRLQDFPAAADNQTSAVTTKKVYLAAGSILCQMNPFRPHPPPGPG
jgi:hypothetical protein